jgi:replicative DNA helicase
MPDISVTDVANSEAAAPSALHSQDMEQSVLGGIILAGDAKPELLDNVMEMLQPPDFYNKQHQIIFRAASRAFEQSGGLDVLSLQNALLREPEASGMPEISEYIQMLADHAAGTTHLADHAKGIRELSMRRALTAAASLIHEKAQYPGEQPMTQLVNEAERMVLGVIDDRSGDEHMLSADAIVHTFLKELEILYKNKKAHVGVPTGLPWLDKRTSGLQPGDLIVLAARPGIGKTSMAINIIEHALTHAEEDAQPIVLFSMEMSSTQVIQRMVSSLSSTRLSDIRSGQLSNADWDRLQKAASRIKDMKHLHVDSSANLDVGIVRHRVRRIKSIHRSRPGLIVIDYLQLMSAILEPGSKLENRNQEISRITRSLKGVAKEFECPVLLLSQLSRQGQQAGRRPALIDLRDSGAIEQDADIVLFLHQKDDGMPDQDGAQRMIELIVAKHRNGEPGRRMLNFDGSKTRFTEASMDDGNYDVSAPRQARRSDAMEDLGQ